MTSKSVITLSIAAIIFLLVANFSLWLNNNIFSRDTFVKTVVSTVRTHEVRNAIASETVDQLFENSPILDRLAGNTLTSAISGLLASDLARPVLDRMAARVNILLTSKRPMGIEFDISPIKGFVKPITSVLEKRFGLAESQQKLPNTITLVKKGEFPSIYSWAIVLLWIGPIVGLIGLGTIIGLIWKSTHEQRPSVLKVIGASMTIGAFLFIVLTTLLKAPILASISSSNAQIIAENLFDAFAGKLTAQTWILTVAGLLLVGAGYLIPEAEGYYKKSRSLKSAA